MKGNVYKASNDMKKIIITHDDIDALAEDFKVESDLELSSG